MANEIKCEMYDKCINDFKLNDELKKFCEDNLATRKSMKDKLPILHNCFQGW